MFRCICSNRSNPMLPVDRIFHPAYACLFLIIPVMGFPVTAVQTSGANSLVVTAILEEPFVFHKSDFARRVGNDRFQGFSIDLLEKLAAYENFTYEIRLAKDGQLGRATSRGWTGMIGELIDREAHLAIGPITIAENISSVVDFTEPFLDSGLTIVIKKPLQRPGRLFQGEKFSLPINNFWELINQTEIQYGITASASTMTFLRDSPNEPYKTMWTYLNTHPENLALTFSEKLDRVRSGAYALIVERIYANHVNTLAPCDITTVNETLPTYKGYGIALQKHSPWTERLSSRIMQWKSDGTIPLLYSHWWNTQRAEPNSNSCS